MLIKKRRIAQLESRIEILEKLVSKQRQYIQNLILKPECNLPKLSRETIEKIVREQLISAIADVTLQEKRTTTVP